MSHYAPIFLLLSIAFSASTKSDEVIVGVQKPESTPYNQPIHVTVLASSAVKSVQAYYSLLPGNLSSIKGWMAVAARQTRNLTGYNEFELTLPEPSLMGQVWYGAKIIFCLEVIAATSSLTCDERQRWNSQYLDDKYVVQFTDPYPPKLVNLKVIPAVPTSLHEVSIVAEVSDGRGSGVSRVYLNYHVDGTALRKLEMQRISSDMYSAVIPPQPARSTVWFQIEAWDNVGNFMPAREPWSFYEVKWTALENRQLASLISYGREMLSLVSFLTPFILVTASIAFLAIFFKMRRRIGSSLNLTIGAVLVYAVLLTWTIAAEGAWPISLLLLTAFIEMWGMGDKRTRGFLLHKALETFVSRTKPGLSDLRIRVSSDPATLLLGAYYITLMGLTVNYLAGFRFSLTQSTSLLIARVLVIMAAIFLALEFRFVTQVGATRKA